MQWGGGGGGCCAAVANAAASIVAGIADCVVVFRSLAQGEYGRFGQTTGISTISGEKAYLMPYGVLAPPQRFAMRVRRFMHEHGVKQEAFRAIALASYHHAQNNPRAVMYGKPLDPAKYDESRWIAEPFHLYDCCMENDGAAAIILVAAERAKEFPHKPVYVLGAAVGSGYRTGAIPHNSPRYASASFETVAPDLYRMAAFAPNDVGVVQSYENFTGGVAMALAEHGFFHLKKRTSFSRSRTSLRPPVDCRSTRAGAILPNATCMAWSLCSKRCAKCVARRPIKSHGTTSRSLSEVRWLRRPAIFFSGPKLPCNERSE